MKGWRRNFEDDPDRSDKIRFDRRILRFLRHIKTWQLLIVLLLFVMLAAIFLRLNNLGMMERKDALIAADKTGDTAKIREATRELQNYVAHHMNTTTGRIALQKSYDRAVNAILENARPPEISETLYQQVTEECAAAWYHGGSVARAKCISEKIGDSGVGGFETPALPSAAAFYVNFASARISFDLAGISVLICLFLIIVIIFRLIFILILRIILKFKYRAA